SNLAEPATCRGAGRRVTMGGSGATSSQRTQWVRGGLAIAERRNLWQDKWSSRSKWARTQALAYARELKSSTCRKRSSHRSTSSRQAGEQASTLNGSRRSRWRSISLGKKCGRAFFRRGAHERQCAESDRTEER